MGYFRGFRDEKLGLQMFKLGASLGMFNNKVLDIKRLNPTVLMGALSDAYF